MRYLSVCSGIEAATVAWHPLGWTPAAFSEIEAFPRAVLAHHYPDTPCHGDFTTIGADEYGPIDLLVGGTPCQSFSIAGLRGGLADDRGNLALEYLRLADRKRPRWLVWENVPGVLSSSEGRDFGAFLGALGELGYGFAYRVLDAQFFGVAQRRRRVFVVGYAGDWRRATAVLFERHSLQGHLAPRREKGPGASGRTANSVAIRGRDGTPQAELGDEVANAILTPNGGRAGVGVGAILETVAALTANGVGTCGADDNQGQAGHLVPSTGETAHCLNAGGMGRQDYETETLIAVAHADIMPTMQNGADTPAGHSARSGHTKDAYVVPVAFAQNARDELREMPVIGALAAQPGMKQQSYVRQASAVRRLTPRECERLQGFPDDYTAVPYRGKPAADGPRYKALGNSMAVPVMRWIGERIQTVEGLASLNEERAEA